MQGNHTTSNLWTVAGADNHCNLAGCYCHLVPTDGPEQNGARHCRPALSHDGFVFRSDRTFRNSLENIAPFFGLSVLAMIAGFSPDRLAIVLGLCLGAPASHDFYYRSPRRKTPARAAIST